MGIREPNPPPNGPKPTPPPPPPKQCVEKFVGIAKRYFRPVIAHPEGAVVHHGDCNIFELGICTCGLLHDLQFYAGCGVEEMYPEYGAEVHRQEQALEILRNKDGA